MNDQYRISDTPADEPRRGLLRPVLWVVLILSAAADAVLSSAVGNPFVSSAFGLVALACAAALIVHHYRGRAR